MYLGFFSSLLTLLEQSRLKEVRARAAQELAPHCAKVRQAFIVQQASQVAARIGSTLEEATHVAARQCAGVLLPDVQLFFDDPELAGLTVGNVLADPARFEGATMADPVEGVEYGR